MKKSRLRAHADSLAKQVQFFQDREAGRRNHADEMFGAAMNDIHAGAEVLIITPSGRRLAATVVNGRTDTDLIDVGNGFVPGLRTVRLELEPHPEH